MIFPSYSPSNLRFILTRPKCRIRIQLVSTDAPESSCGVLLGISCAMLRQGSSRCKLLSLDHMRL